MSILTADKVKYNQVTKSFLLSLFFSVILPGVCWMLFAANTTAGRRDVLPELNDPLETIGYIGFMFLMIPAWIALLGSIATMNYLEQQGVLALSAGINERLGAAILVLSVLIHVLVWFFMVHSFNEETDKV